MSEELTTIPSQQPVTIAGFIGQAIASGKSPEFMRELLAVKKEWDEIEARKAFNLAVSEFQRRAPIIAKADKAHDKFYARMDRIWREIRPLLTELGLSVTWQVCELKQQGCHVEGQLRHRDGHGERLVMDIPLPELIRGQNLAQQMGSANQYAKRYATCGALGVVTGEDDDDGNKAGTQFITKEQIAEISESLDACRGLPAFDEAKFWAWVGCNAQHPSEIPDVRYNDVRGFLSRKLGAK